MGDVTKGHLSDCNPSTGAASPSRECDCETRQGINSVIQALQLTGWKREPGRSLHCLSMVHGDHIITLAKVYDGWQYTWQRGPTWTVTEKSGYGLVSICLNDLWKEVFGIYERYSAFQIEEAKRLVEIGRPPPPKHKYLVVIAREGTTAANAFDTLREAAKFHDDAGTQWSESFLCEVLKGPLV